MSVEQQACVYAVLTLGKDGKKDPASIQAVCKAAGIDVKKGLATAFSKFAMTMPLDDLLKNIALGGGGGGAAPAEAAPAAGGKKEEKKKEPEPEPEEEEDGGFGGLFD